MIVTCQSVARGYASGKRRRDEEEEGKEEEAETDDEDDMPIKLITFHEDEIGELYEEDTMFYNRDKTNKLPSIKKILNGNQED